MDEIEIKKFAKQFADSLAQVLRTSSLKSPGVSDNKQDYAGRRRPAHTESVTRNRQEANASKQFLKAQEELLQATKTLTNFRESELKGAKASAEGIAAQQAYNDAMENVTASMHLVGSSLDKTMFSLSDQIKNFKDLEKKTSGLTESLAQSQINSSLLAASLIQNHIKIEAGSTNYAVYLGKLGKATNSLSQSYLEQQGIIDSNSKRIKEDLDPKKFAELRTNLGLAKAAIMENLAKISVTNPEDIVHTAQKNVDVFHAPSSEGAKSAEAFNDSLLTIAKTLKAAGHEIETDLTGSISLSSAQFVKLAKEVAAANASIDKSISHLNEVGRDANTSGANMATASRKVYDKLDKFKESLINGTVAANQFSKAQTAGIKVFHQLESFNVANIPDTFLHVQAASVKLGMSFDDTVKFMQENNKLVALYGPEKLNELNNQMRSTFHKFGYTMAQGAELYKPATEAAVAVGLDVGNAGQLNMFIEDTMKSFKALGSTVGVSLTRYAELNSELANTADISDTLLGMDQQQALLYNKSLQSQRDELVTRGISIVQAQQIVKQQEAAKRQKVTSRMTEAAMVAVQGQMLGLDPGDVERARRVQTLGTAAPREEQEWFNKDFTTKFNKALADKNAMYAGTGDSASLFNEAVIQMMGEKGGTQLQSIESYKPVVQADKSKMGVQGEKLAKNAEAAAPSVAVGLASEISNIFGAIKDNAFVGFLWSASTGLAALAAQSFITSAAIGGGGILGTFKNLAGILTGRLGGGLATSAATSAVSSLVPGALGTGATVAGVAAGAAKTGLLSKLAGGGLARGLGGLALDVGGNYVGDAIQDAGYVKTGALAKILAAAGGGALSGSALGPWGALAGGLAMGGYSAYENWNDLWGNNTATPVTSPATTPVVTKTTQNSPQASTTETVNNTAYTSGIINVSDAGANIKLGEISDNLKIAITLLQQIATNGQTLQYAPQPGYSDTSPNGVRPITPASTYITGGRR